MPDATLLLLHAGFLLVSVLYSVTGHGGASSYIAIMVLLGMAPQEIRPMALGLNVIVSLIASVQFYRAGYFNKSLFLPFALSSVPMAYLGGTLQIADASFKLLLGIALLVAAFRLVPRERNRPVVAQGHIAIPILAGLCIGFVSGLIGIGGGIFLTPLLILMGWATPKQAAAVSAPFILVNSVAALAGTFSQQADLPGYFALSALTVTLGGLAGSYLGSRKLPNTAIARVLSGILVLAGLKLCLA